MDADKGIDCLVHEKVVPCLWNIVRLVEDDHSEDDLGDDDGDACGGGDPGIYIGNPTGIALPTCQ